MDEKTFMEYFLGTIGAWVYAALVIGSGALPFALAGGELASGAASIVSREWPITLAVGGAVAFDCISDWSRANAQRRVTT